MKNIGIILLLAIGTRMVAQPTDIRFQGNFRAVPFDTFVTNMERQTGARFFYRPEWITGITVSAEGNQLSIREILDNTLRGSDLYFYIDSGGTVILTKGTNLITTLPLYEAADVSRASDGNGNTGFLTESEISYLEGRKQNAIETIIIGNPGVKTSGKTLKVTGRIKDKESGEALTGVVAYIEETGKGYVTDADGHFLLSMPAGKYTIVFSSMGMEELTRLLEIYSDGQLNVEMSQRLIPLDAVHVTANRFHNVKGTQMGFEYITLKTIKEIPVVLGERDVLKVAQMLPGVQNAGEGTSGYNVRGSSADQNMFYINKIPVYNTSHLLGFFSAFNPDIVRDFSLYKSNIPVKYGGRLSSIFNLTSPQGNKKKFTAHGGISPITGHLMVEGPLKKEKHSFFIAARSTYSDWLLSQLKNPDLRNSNAAFYDLAGHLSLEPDERNSIKVFGYFSHDKFSLATTNHYQYYNRGISVDWKHRWRSNLNSEIALITADYSFQTTDSTLSIMAYEQNYNIGHYEIRSDLVWVPAKDHLVTMGLNSILYRLDRGNVSPVGDFSARVPLNLGIEKGVELAVYIADEYQVFRNLTLAMGLRYSFYGMPGPATVYDYNPGSPRDSIYISDTIHYSGNDLVAFYSGPELRGSLNIRTGENSSVKLSYNKTRQYLFMLSNTIAVSPSDQWKLCDYHIRPPHTDQYSVGFYKDFNKKDINFTSEVYYKKTRDIIEYKDGANFISDAEIETQLLQGTQLIYGLELMLRKNTGRLSGWISYSYSNSTIHVDGTNPWEKINLGLAYPSNYDRPHALNTVFNYRFSRQLSVGSNIVYSTGRPVTYPVSIYYIDGREHVYYSLRNGYRIPDYFRMDLSINIEGNLKARKFAHSSWMLSVYNLTGRRNAYSVFFTTENRKIKSYKMSIFGIPVFTITWNFKLGNYASE